MSTKNTARLSSGLLSRKGLAAPSAGPETRANMVGSLHPTDSPDASLAETTRPQPRQGPAPARSTLADWVLPNSAPAPDRRGQSQGQSLGKRMRVSLRLDEDRHTRLKLVATQRNCTLQSLFTEAIDEFFIRHAPDLHGISAHLRRGAAEPTSGDNSTRVKRNAEGRNGPSRSR
jgi:predicted DNA-binding ribbon-helix-helix protein